MCGVSSGRSRGTVAEPGDRAIGDENLAAGAAIDAPADEAELGEGGGGAVSGAHQFDGGDPESDPENSLDVLVVYTSATVANEGSLNALLALINQGVVDTNQAFQASSIDATLSLVGTEEVSYTGTDSGPMLSLLRSTTDGIMDSVHSLRDSLGADLVSLWARFPMRAGEATV